MIPLEWENVYMDPPKRPNTPNRCFNGAFDQNTARGVNQNHEFGKSELYEPKTYPLTPINPPPTLYYLGASKNSGFLNLKSGAGGGAHAASRPWYFGITRMGFVWSMPLHHETSLGIILSSYEPILTVYMLCKNAYTLHSLYKAISTSLLPQGPRSQISDIWVCGIGDTADWVRNACAEPLRIPNSH